MSALYWRD